jgi:hypothetical protein
MKFVKYILFAVLVFVAIKFIANPLIGVNERTSACSETNVSILCNYMSFDGTKATNQDIDQLEVHKGQVLHVDYNVVVKTGDLSLITILTGSQNDKNHISIWNNTLHHNKSETIDIPINDDGKIMFQISGSKTSGSYDIKWNIK